MRVRVAVALLAACALLPGARVAGLIGPGAAATAPPRVSFLDGGTTASVLPAAPARGPIPGLDPTVAVPTLPPAATPVPDPAGTPPPTTARVTSTSSFVAQVRGDGVDVHADPTDPRPMLHLSPVTEFGSARVLLVVRAANGWLQVLLPVRPNNSVGWIRAGAVDLMPSHDEVVVDLAAHELEWRHELTVVLRTPVAVGAASSPTPPGEYFVTDVLAGGGAYGPFILALNGHSDTYTEFGGGDARIALHGTNDPASIGTAASHGCVRLPNDLITQLASRLAPGTPVTIR
jgi:hypothetical protein